MRFGFGKRKVRKKQNTCIAAKMGLKDYSPKLVYFRTPARIRTCPYSAGGFYTFNYFLPFAVFCKSLRRIRFKIECRLTASLNKN
jgi:hypothetical protein